MVGAGPLRALGQTGRYNTFHLLIVGEILSASAASFEYALQKKEGCSWKLQFANSIDVVLLLREDDHGWQEVMHAIPKECCGNLHLDVFRVNAEEYFPSIPGDGNKDSTAWRREQDVKKQQ